MGLMNDLLSGKKPAGTGAIFCASLERAKYFAHH